VKVCLMKLSDYPLEAKTRMPTLSSFDSQAITLCNLKALHRVRKGVFKKIKFGKQSHRKSEKEIKNVK